MMIAWNWNLQFLPRLLPPWSTQTSLEKPSVGFLSGWPIRQTISLKKKSNSKHIPLYTLFRQFTLRATFSWPWPCRRHNSSAETVDGIGNTDLLLPSNTSQDPLLKHWADDHEIEPSVLYSVPCCCCVQQVHCFCFCFGLFGFVFFPLLIIPLPYRVSRFMRSHLFILHHSAFAINILLTNLSLVPMF